MHHCHSFAGFQLVAACLLGGCLVGLSGCGKHPSVTGRVVFPDGAPLRVGEVVLDNGVVMGRGSLDDEGRFIIGFTRPGNGIPPGWYDVGIMNASEGGMNDWLVDQKFLNPQTSGVRFEVSADKTNELLITVTRPLRRGRAAE